MGPKDRKNRYQTKNSDSYDLNGKVQFFEPPLAEIAVRPFDRLISIVKNGFRTREPTPFQRPHRPRRKRVSRF
jgi:hypothetical protein